jgi:hypothetical protein
MEFRWKLISAGTRMLYDSSSLRSCVLTMDVAMFEDLIDRLGEDLSRWPSDQRLAAEQLLATSSVARTLHEEARVLRKVLGARPVGAPAGLADRIVAAAGRLKAEQAASSSQSEADAEKKPAGLAKTV